MRLSELIATTSILSSKASTDLNINQIKTNSKDIVKGDLYIAIAGHSFDGHQFIQEAVRNGAAAVVIEKKEFYTQFSNVILVSSTRKVLAEAASSFLNNPSKHLNVVGFTGTNGKTTCTYLLEQVWKKLKYQTALVGTIENRIINRSISSQLTTPDALQLQSMFNEAKKEKVTHFSMEVSSIALDQYRTWGTSFTVGVYTNLTQDHLDYHQSMENYFNTKLKFFTEYSIPNIVINLDDSFGGKILGLSSASKKITFSTGANKADFQVLKQSSTVHGTSAKLKTPVGDFDFYSPLVGEFNLSNCLAVISTLYSLGEDISLGLLALSSCEGAPGRLENVMKDKQYPSIYVDYAHSEDALKNVLQTLIKLKSGDTRIITVFGCGGDRDKSKRPKMGRSVCELSDYSVVTSDNPRTENANCIIDEITKGMSQPFHTEVNRKKAIHYALSMAKPADIVLIAGKGHETYQIIGTESFPFDDREVVKDYYK